MNRNGGFTIVGWYKRGFIKDKTLVAGSGNTSHHNNNDKVQIEAVKISYDIVQIIPQTGVLYEVVPLFILGSIKGNLTLMKLKNQVMNRA